MWKETAKDDYVVAQDLIASHHNDWGLFMGQLVLEKLLKGIITKRCDEAPPFTHDLKILARAANIPLTDKQRSDFETISSFNVGARYGYIKDKLYKKATPEYTEEWFTKISTYREWLLSYL